MFISKRYCELKVDKLSCPLFSVLLSISSNFTATLGAVSGQYYVITFLSIKIGSFIIFTKCIVLQFKLLSSLIYSFLSSTLFNQFSI